MRDARLGSLVLVSTVLLAGCELMVQLDRSAAPVEEDAGCSICSDAAGDDGDDAASLDSAPMFDGDAGASTDAHPDGPVPDGGDKGDG